MTSTINESTTTSTIIVTSNDIPGVSIGDRVPFVAEPFGSETLGVVILDTGAAAWLIGDTEIRDHAVLAPHRGKRGWWVTARNVDPGSVEQVTPEVDFSDVPVEYRHLLPEGARWVRTTEVVDNAPCGEYLAINDGEDAGQVVIMSWPGHPSYSIMGNRDHSGVPLPLHGYYVRGGSYVEVDQADTSLPSINPDVVALHTRIAELEAQVLTERTRAQNFHDAEMTVRNHWTSDLNLIGEIMVQEAEDRDWCSEYEGVIEKINRTIEGSIENALRDVEVVVSFSGYVNVPFTGQVTLEVPRGYSSTTVNEAFMEHMSDTYLSSMDLELGEADYSDVSDDDLSVDDFEEN